MRSLPKYIHLPILAAATGAVGAFLRFFLYRTGFDEKGLLTARSPLHIACWVLAAAAAVCFALSVRKLDGSARYRNNFHASRVCGLGDLCAGALLLAASFLVMKDAQDRMEYARAFLGCLAACCLAVTGWCRMAGKRPFFAFHALVCVFFAVDMICRYRVWSGNPQLEDYCFHLLACVFLTLAAYHRTAFDAGMGSRRMSLFATLMAMMLCLLSLVGPDNSLFYLGGAVWAAANLCRLEPVLKPQLPGEEG